MGIFLAVLVPVVIAVFAMQMERFEDYCTCPPSQSAAHSS